jgi:pyruvate formate lyase activating enzyme
MKDDDAMRKEASYYRKSENQDGSVFCLLCPVACHIRPGKHGVCLVRENEAGSLIAASYGKVTSIALDPIEKKPLYLFHPGSRILSVGSFGCNFKCPFCQNWSISQQEAPFREITPSALVESALQTRSQGNIGIAYTYNEPLVGYEYVYDCASAAKESGLMNVLVTNGYINPEPMQALLPLIDAMNIDLKAFNGEFYRKECKGDIERVKDTIRLCAGSCHIEVTTLIIPGLNDRDDEISSLAAWIASVSPDIPLHISRHHPDYEMTEPAPASRGRLDEIAALARKSLKHVFIGNI